MEKASRSRLEDVFTSAEMEKMQSFINLSYGGDSLIEDDDIIANPFITSEFLLDKLDKIVDKKCIDLSVFKAILRALKFLPNIDAIHLLDKHAELLYYVPREYCLALNAASKQENFNSQVVKDKVVRLFSMAPYSDLVYVRTWLLNLFIDGTLPVNLSDWHAYDFNQSIIERRSGIFFRGLADDRAYFRRLKTQLGSLSEWEKPAFLMAAMCLPLDEYKTWLTASIQHIPGPFARIYISWLEQSHGKLHELLSKPQVIE